MKLYYGIIMTDSRQDDFRASAETGERMRRSAADRNFKIALQDFGIDQQFRAQTGGSGLLAAAKGIMIIDRITADDFLTQFFSKVGAVHHSMQTAGADEPYLAVADTGFLQFLYDKRYYFSTTGSSLNVIKNNHYLLFAPGQFMYGL